MAKSPTSTTSCWTQSSVIKALKQNDYQYYSVGSSYGASDRAPLAEYNYGDVTPKLLGAESPRCKQMESLPAATTSSAKK